MAQSEVKIYTTFDSFDADQVVATLEHNGIPCIKRTEGSGQYIGIIMGYMSTHEVSVFVPGEAVEKAVDVLTQTGYLQDAEENEDGES